VLSLLANRTFSGVVAMADASSSQSRADVICLVFAVTLALTGLQWLALKTKPPVSVELFGDEVFFLHPDLDEPTQKELRWVWEALESSCLCGSLVVLSGQRRLMQAGRGTNQMDLGPEAPVLGPICSRAVETGKGNYLANMALFPGRVEFQPFLPINTQGVLVQPLGNQGILIAATGTVRGFSQLDQAWISVVCDKLEVALELWNTETTQ